MAQNYTLGRGKVYFSRYITGTQDPIGYLYIGNTPEFSLTIESETLDHFSSDAGIREKDDSVALETTRTGSFTTDNISAENVALFFFGSASTLTQSAITSTPYTVADVVPGMFYQLGLSSSNVVGHRKLNPSGLTVAMGGTTYVLNTDYRIDTDTGLIEIVSGGAIVSGSDLTVTYAVLSSTRSRVISGSTPVEGALRYIANNPKGDNRDYIMPWVKITPNGDYALKGDEWQTIPFSVEALKPTFAEAIYVDGRPL
jgi:hypothetical protein